MLPRLDRGPRFSAFFQQANQPQIEAGLRLFFLAVTLKAVRFKDRTDVLLKRQSVWRGIGGAGSGVHDERQRQSRRTRSARPFHRPVRLRALQNDPLVPWHCT